MTKSFPFQEAPNTPVFVCQHILNGASLFRVYHLPKEKTVWHMLCKEHHIEADQRESTLQAMLEICPEIAELSDMPQDTKVMLQRGVDSGKWYDFHIED